jgi:8-oxo-dGTP diphosphatase
VASPPQAEPGEDIERPASPPAVVAAGAVVLDALERVLLVLRARAPAAGEWSLPGGRVEGGELPGSAAVRELREETAIVGRVVAALGVVEIRREGFTFEVHEFLVEPATDAVARPGDDAAGVRWARRDELDSLGVRTDAIAVIERALAARRVLGS